MIETGRRENIERDTARALAKALDCTVGWLMEGEGVDPCADLGEPHPSATPPATPNRTA